MSKDRRLKRDLHAVNDDGMVLCNPRDKEAAHRIEMEGIATNNRDAVTCPTCLSLLYKRDKARKETKGNSMGDPKKDADTNVDPLGQKMYEEVLRKDLFDKDHPPPLTGVREFTVNHLFANVWSRSRETAGEHLPLSLRERRLVTIALLAAQGRSDQLKEHVTGACRAGIAKETLIELMVHVAHYGGWAAGASGQGTVLAVYKNEASG